MGASAPGKRFRSGMMFAPTRRQFAGAGSPLLLQANVARGAYEAGLMEDSTQYGLGMFTGRGVKTDMGRIVERLEKMSLQKPKNIKKNIRVSL
jgi:hypothetical protein